MQAPRTYQEWFGVLEALAGGRDDAAVHEAISRGELARSSGAVQRLAERFVHAYEARLQADGRQLEAALAAARDEADYRRALAETRQRLARLDQIAGLRVLPRRLGDLLTASVDLAARRLEEALLGGAASDRTGRLAAAIRAADLPGYRQDLPQGPGAPGRSRPA